MKIIFLLYRQVVLGRPTSLFNVCNLLALENFYLIVLSLFFTFTASGKGHLLRAYLTLI